MSATKQPSFTLAEIARICGGRLVSDGLLADKVVRRVATIDEADGEALTWLAEAKLAAGLNDCRAAGIIGREQQVGSLDRGIVVDDPQLAVAIVLDAFYTPPAPPAPGVHPSASVHPSVELGADAAVGAFAALGEGVVLGQGAAIHEGVSLGRDVHIGDRTIVYDRCVIYDRCRLGRDVIVHAGTVIGADGFGYIFREGRHRKLSHLGTVIIEDEVEIGANTCIDRGKVGATRIGRGTKIDDLVMIAHNVQIGPLCIITGQVGIAGSARMGTGVTMGGRSGLVHGITVGDGARIAVTSVLHNDAPAGSVVSGDPAQNHQTELRDIARVRKLPRLLQRVAELEKRVAELEDSADH
jgi:UDP-3-O-[3-hydroxymyristoyl] glucosamine N-acyltransferase